MAELFLSAVLPVLFEKLTSPELLKFATQEGVRSKLKKWEKTLKMINALLNDAEQKQLEDGAVKIWLEELQDLVYDAEDILDEYATEALTRKLKIEEHQASTSTARKLIPACCISCTPTALWTDFLMRSKMDDITSRYQDLCKRKTELGLVEIARAGGRSTASCQRPPTTSLRIEPAVHGRGEDKAKILELVLTHKPGDANFDVIPIVGMGGIGKTTLAREVYNDTAVNDFKPKAWVYISDDFDVMRISKSILECITLKSCDNKKLEAVQQLIQNELREKKFLIVLDDVWWKKDDYDLWESLKAPFMAGAPGSKIIVTTRSTEVASTMRARDRYDLTLLSDDDCWAIFVKHAFGNTDPRAVNREKVNEEKVLQKCKGLPLAAKALGGIFYHETIEDRWMNMLNSRLWDTDGNILPVLRLSYHHLPLHLKRCFVYCSILPKGYEFEEKELVLLWIAEGLIQQSNNNLSLEDLGGEYFYDLLSRLIFQISSSNSSKFIMHDLINDLAQMVARKISFRLEDELESNNQLRVCEKTRYASYICELCNGKRKFEVLNDAKHHLRTHLPMQLMTRKKTCYISNQVVCNLLSRFQKLRALSLQYYYIVKLPDLIGGLRLLRYLNLSFSYIRNLPESINSMCNLQTLLLRGCHKLLKLPYNMGNLINLRHLDILGASLIKEMPLGVRKWRYLRTLSNFILGKDFGANLEDLKDLKSLCRELWISKLENMTNFQDIKMVILSDKKDLKVLLLEWGYRTDESQGQEVESQDEKVLDMLQPHKNLETLIIKCYRGTQFSSWVGGTFFLESKITILELVDCKNCTSLPPLGLLGSLKILTIKGMKGIRNIGSEFYGEHCAKPFQSLETLCFEKLEECEYWVPVKEDDSFLKLQELYIVDCPKLCERLPDNLSSLKKLEIHRCEHLVVSLSNIPMLCELKFDNCKKIECKRSAYFKSLQSMTLSNIFDFGNWSMEEFKQVQNLQIEGCNELVELWQNEIFIKRPHQGVHSFISFKNLVIKDCDIQFTTLLEGIEQKNSHVEELSIESCNSLNFIFKGQILQSLKKLHIKNCRELDCVVLSKKVNTNTCHLKDLNIDGCPSLTCLPLIDTLTSLSVSNCSRLKTIGYHHSTTLTSLYLLKCSKLIILSETGDLPVALKHIQIEDCQWLTIILLQGHFPKTLETLRIQSCGDLELIADEFHDNNALHEIYIKGCDKLKSLPEGLDTLSSLRSITIDNCRGLTSFPEGGFPCSNLTVRVRGCKEVKALASGIHTLSSLEIQYCPNLSLSEEGLPTKLTYLSIQGHKQCKELMERGWHNFTSLKWLKIYAGSFDRIEDEDMTISFPSTLMGLWIIGFPFLKNLSFKEFQDLPSLKLLKFAYCVQLSSLPSLPSSLCALYILGCPLLKEACKRDEGEEWSKIADIPRIEIDENFIYDLE